MRACPTPVTVLVSIWGTLLVAAGLNAGWLFTVLIRADLAFREARAAVIDAPETGRIMAGVLAQPGFLGVFAFGMLAGPVAAWMLLRHAGRVMATRRLRLGAVTLLMTAAIGVGQMVLARSIADHAVERTQAILSEDAERAAAARAELDRMHRRSERLYGLQGALLAASMLLVLPGSRPRQAVCVPPGG
ncbi:MAG: hypothetical protein RLZZ558_521 [Planctomycetota bacterium]